MHPAFQVLQPWVAELGPSLAMPSISQLNQWRGPEHPGFAEPVPSDLPYELQIARHARVPTRPDNWHDALNALCWLAWPRSKWAIHRGHRAIIEAGGEAELRRRSPARDVLTLLDEGGAIVLSSDARLFEPLRRGDWQTLFVTQRRALEQHARLLLLGHGALDDLRVPRLGTTSKCLLFEVSDSVLRLPAIQMRAHADQLVAERLEQIEDLGIGRQYPPLPVMGWPGWHPQNSDPHFYACEPEVFRPRNPNALAQTR